MIYALVSGCCMHASRSRPAVTGSSLPSRLLGHFLADVLVLRPVSDAYRNRLIVHPWDMGTPANHSSIESAIMYHDAGAY